jgi:hypothetical protein
MELILLGVFLYVAVFGIGGFATGKQKGLNLLGFLPGAILGPLGIVILCAIPAAPSFICPECGGLISPVHRKCKNCGSDLVKV